MAQNPNHLLTDKYKAMLRMEITGRRWVGVLFQADLNSTGHSLSQLHIVNTNNCPGALLILAKRDVLPQWETRK